MLTHFLPLYGFLSLSLFLGLNVHGNRAITDNFIKMKSACTYGLTFNYDGSKFFPLS